MCKTKEGKNAYHKRMRIGKLFSFWGFQKWVNVTDRSFRYHRQTGLMGIPSGRGHYFGEIRPENTFFPVKKGIFEGMEVDLPGRPQDYLANLYGEGYMKLPPVEKRERHFIFEIKFKGERVDGE